MLGRQCALNNVTGEHARRMTIVVAAHQDDETIGIGGLIGREVQSGKRVVVVYVTNGCLGHPAGVDQEHRVGLRAREARAALSEVGIPGEDVFLLGFPDSLSYMYMSEIVEDLVRLFRILRPVTVYCHSIEGGHLDHDVVAYVTQRAAMRSGCTEVKEWAEYSPKFPLTACVTGFPFGDPHTVESIHLTAAESRTKNSMLAHYHGQLLPPGAMREVEHVRRANVASVRSQLLEIYASSTFYSLRLSRATADAERTLNRLCVCQDKS